MTHAACMCHEITHPMRKFNRSIRISPPLNLVIVAGQQLRKQ